MFVTNNAYNQYRTTSIQTASPGKLLLMLYDGLVLSLRQAEEAIKAEKPAEAHRFLVKSQDIIDELIISLNMDYEISHNLLQLYDFWKDQLIQANIQKDVQMINIVKGLAGELRETWAAIIEPVQADAVVR